MIENTAQLGLDVEDSGRNRIFRILALVAAIGLSVQTACDKRKETSTKYHSVASQTPEIQPSFAKPPIPPGKEEVQFAPHPGILSKIKPVKTCNIDSEGLKKMDMFKRFAEVDKNCKGKRKSDDQIYLQTTISGYHIDENLFHDLDSIFNNAGFTIGLPRVAERAFIFHRMDGKDGLPGGNLLTFGSVAMTGFRTNVSKSYTSLPMQGDKGKDASVLATEICQTHMITQENDNLAESVCNSYGQTVRSIYAGYTYKQYLEFISTSKALLVDGTMLPMLPYPEKTYEALKIRLKDLPDILVSNK